MARTPDGPPPPPVVQKLRVRYAKRGRLRFTSHRDFQRAFERAIRRAGIPIAFSAGFTPHPKVSYVGAAPTGVASEAEYLELGVSQRCDPYAVRDALDAALPDGLDVVEVVEGTVGALPDRVDTSRWLLELPTGDEAALREAAEDFLARERVLVERLLKDGRRQLDARAAVVSIEALTSDRLDDTERAVTVGDVPCAILRLVVRHATPAVRPDDVLAALRQVTDRVPPTPEVRVTRLAQGSLGADGRLADPLAPDREATTASVAGAMVAG